jgi:hypothetical protein
MGAERNRNSETISLCEENSKKNIWAHKYGVKTNEELDKLIKHKNIIIPEQLRRY